MKAIFVGGGRGCHDVLEMYVKGQLAILNLEILAVVDIDPEAPAMKFARERDWRTTTDLEKALLLDDLELIIELTGSEDVLDKIFFNMPPGVRVMDHVMARVFWDLETVTRTLRQQLVEKTGLETQIAADRAALQEILDNLPDIVMVLDRDRAILRVNRNFEAVTGILRENAIGLYCNRNFFSFDSDVEDSERTDPIQQAMETGKPVTVMEAVEFGDEEEKYYQITVNPIIDESGKISRIIRTSREITEQVMLKHETEEWARRFRQIVGAVHGIITIKDLEGRYQLVNPRAEWITGLKQEEMIGKTAHELFSGASADTIAENERQALATGGYHATEEVLDVGGKEHILISERFPLTDYRGNVVAICCVSRDDTEARQLQQELVQTERLAAVGKLSAGVAHELNNPLTGILTFAEDLLLEADPEDPARQDYEVILNEAMRCRHIVRDLLDFSRQKAPERRPFDINTIIRRTLTMIERQASFHNIAFTTVLGSGLPRVLLDPRQMQQALLNMMINARDAMNRSGEISINSEPADAGRRVLITLTDTGCGIPEDQLSQIFQPFFSTKGDMGNGLGLPTVLSVIQQHGGKIDVESTIGEGSTFRIILPSASRAKPGKKKEGAT